MTPEQRAAKISLKAERNQLAGEVDMLTGRLWRERDEHAALWGKLREIAERQLVLTMSPGPFRDGAEDMAKHFLKVINSLTPAPKPTWTCQSCGLERTEAQGGKVFTVCDSCYERTKPEAVAEPVVVCIACHRCKAHCLMPDDFAPINGKPCPDCLDASQPPQRHESAPEASDGGSKMDHSSGCRTGGECPACGKGEI